MLAAERERGLRVPTFPSSTPKEACETADDGEVEAITTPGI